MPRPHPSAPSLDANQRFKRRFDHVLWGSMITATAAHAALFALWPAMSAEALDLGDEAALTHVEIPEVKLPEPPERIHDPATPIASSDITDDITMATTDFDNYEVQDAPPPPPAETTAAAAPAFVPYNVAPRILNPEDVSRALEREYPSVLRDAGVGGRVILHVQVGVDGQPGGVQVATPSEHPALDAAAIEVARIIRFSPALNGDRVVAVWIALPITFTVR